MSSEPSNPANNKDKLRLIGAAAMILLCAVIVIVIVIMVTRDQPRKDDSALPECNANNYSQFAYDGDTLYFVGNMGASNAVSLFSENAQGEQTKLLEDDAVRRFRLCGDQILYLCVRDGNYELSMLPKAGGESRGLVTLPEKDNATVSEFDLKGNTLYYLYDRVLYATDITQGSLATVAVGVTSFVLSGDDVYYSKADGIYRLKKGADTPETVAAVSGAAGLALSGTRLYYRTGEGIFYLDTKNGGEAVVVPDGSVTSFCVRDGTVYYIRAVSQAEKAELAAAMAEEQGMETAEAEEYLTGVGHLFRVNGSGGMPISVGGRYVAAFAMSPEKIYYKAFLYSRVFYEYKED